MSPLREKYQKDDQRKSRRDKFYIPLITGVSILIPVVVSVLMVLPERDTQGSLSGLPVFHATLNGITAVMLLLGFYFVKRKQIIQHKFSMLTAFTLSSMFLISYVIYHFNIGHIPYGGEGFIRVIYFVILISHISLAVTIVPLALLAIYRAFTDEIQKHKKIVRWTFPLWLYVAVTGVLVYFFMRPYYYGST